MLLPVILGIAVCGVLLALHAILIAPFRPVVRKRTLPLPAGWPRVTVLHLSDLHVQAGGDRLFQAQRRVLRSLASQPDLVCVTGDLCERVSDAPRVAELLHEVRPRLGTFAILGNHEHNAFKLDAVRGKMVLVLAVLEWVAHSLLGSRGRSSGSAEADAIADTLSRAGLRILRNEGARVLTPDGSLWVAGLDSVWAGQAHAAAAMRGRAPDEPCLALVHEPEGALPMVARGAALALAGHTHGGQVALPFIGALYTLRADPRIHIAAGLQRLGAAWLHISTGLGHTTRLRFGCPPEITWIEWQPVPPAATEQDEATEALATAA